MKERISFRGSPFEIDNARKMTRDQVVKTFIPVQSFWRLLSVKHHILQGSRGSGKTEIAKMLSHEHLSLLDEPRAKNIIRSKEFIGIYVPTKLKWVGGLRNKPWQTEAEMEEFFQWRLNIASCLAFINTIDSCLVTYIEDKGERARKERILSQLLTESWVENDRSFSTLTEIFQYLEDIEYRKQQQIIRKRSIGYLEAGEKPEGIIFEMELFEPLKRGIILATRVLNMPEYTAWLLCLDEAEFLTEAHHRILNSHMRAHSGNLFFKITTKPYCHYTLETNTRETLDPLHDFEYIYLDRDKIYLATTTGERGPIGTLFGRELFSKRVSRASIRYSKITIGDLFGSSEILDPKQENWSKGSRNMQLLEQYASKDTINRAKRLLGTKDFMPQIGRKIHGTLILRHRVETTKGSKKLDVYSGTTMVIRCGDSNPRRIIQIFNKMFLTLTGRHRDQKAKTPQRLEEQIQTEKLIQFSDIVLSGVRSERKCGSDLYDFLTMIGEYMKITLYEKKLTTDEVSSIKIDNNINDKDWQLIKTAVGLALLYPNVSQNNPDELPVRNGTFHIAYALAPHFRILPRRGHYKSLEIIKKIWKNRAHYKTDIEQKTLFPEYDY